MLDEPTASLDVSIQAQIIALLAELRDRLGLTYLFISHDLGLVRYFCDRIVVMYLGAVVEVLPDARSRAAPSLHPRADGQHLRARPRPAPRASRRWRAKFPSPFDLPPGCAFAGRCPRATDRCRAERPALAADADGHPVACFHPL